MPIHIDILENEVLGPVFMKGLQEGRQEGRQEGELTVLGRLIEKRFGPLPDWAAGKLSALPAPGLEDLIERVLDAKSLDDLLK